MKRYIAILLIVSLILSMTSCRSSDTEPEDSEKTSVEMMLLHLSLKHMKI